MVDGSSFPIDNEFNLARKIIGAKGNNMKNIIEKVNKRLNVSSNELVKLRLRGKGSSLKTVTNEPIHLCVSCRSKPSYDVTCLLVEELFAKLIDEYKNLPKNRHSNKNYKINKTEEPNINNKFYKVLD